MKRRVYLLLIRFIQTMQWIFWKFMMILKGAHIAFAIRAHNALPEVEREDETEKHRFRMFLMNKGSYP